MPKESRIIRHLSTPELPLMEKNSTLASKEELILGFGIPKNNESGELAKKPGISTNIMTRCIPNYFTVIKN
jgi:hypothetical protein